MGTRLIIEIPEEYGEIWKQGRRKFCEYLQNVLDDFSEDVALREYDCSGGNFVADLPEIIRAAVEIGGPTKVLTSLAFNIRSGVFVIDEFMHGKAVFRPICAIGDATYRIYVGDDMSYDGTKRSFARLCIGSDDYGEVLASSSDGQYGPCRDIPAALSSLKENAAKKDISIEYIEK